MNEIGNWYWTQCNDTVPEMIKLPTVHPADKRHHIIAMPFSASETDVESRSAREGSITTDDSVCHQSD
jgi:hypothetical protein